MSRVNDSVGSEASSQDLICSSLIFFPHFSAIEENSTGSASILGYLYYLLIFAFLYQLMRALYIAAFLNARRTFVDKPG